MKPLLEILLSYRRTLLVAGAGALTFGVILLLAAAVLLPRERTASIQFRLLFDGAADGRYPNGTTFSPAEIIATPVLSEVYRINELQRFGQYADFKDSMGVLQSSLEQDMLAAAYSARLADAKLSPVDRGRIEEEYRKKREAIKDPVYTLTLRRNERLKTMPEDLLEKVLNDTLAIWAKQADELKGATHFDVPAFSKDSLRADLLDGEFLIAADDLRLHARRAQDVAGQLMEVSGANTVRIDKNGVTLPDVSFALAEILRNRIEPVLYLVQERGISRNSTAIGQYLHGHVAELRLQRDRSKARIQIMEDALQAYMGGKAGRPRDTTAASGSGTRPTTAPDAQTLIPQFSDSFLDRLMEMSSETQASDMKFRQKMTNAIIEEGEKLSDLDRSTSFYEGLEKTVKATGGSGTPAEVALVQTQLRAAYDALAVTLDQLVRLYDGLSAQRLNPGALLFAVTEPFSSRTQYALPLTQGLMLISLILSVTLLATIVGCVVHHARSRQLAPVPHR